MVFSFYNVSKNPSGVKWKLFNCYYSLNKAFPSAEESVWSCVKLNYSLCLYGNEGYQNNATVFCSNNGAQ